MSPAEPWQVEGENPAGGGTVRPSHTGRGWTCQLGGLPCPAAPHPCSRPVSHVNYLSRGSQWVELEQRGPIDVACCPDRVPTELPW